MSKLTRITDNSTFGGEFITENSKFGLTLWTHWVADDRIYIVPNDYVPTQSKYIDERWIRLSKRNFKKYRHYQDEDRYFEPRKIYSQRNLLNLLVYKLENQNFPKYIYKKCQWYLKHIQFENKYYSYNI